MSGIGRCAVLILPLLAGAALAGPPAAASAPHAVTPLDAEARFAALEHAYVLYSLSRSPVMATYLGGAAFDPQLAAVDGTLADDSPAAIAAQDAHLRGLRAQFAAFELRHLSPRRRIDRAVALAQIDFLLHQHEVLRRPQRALDTYVEEPVRGVDRQLQAMIMQPGAATFGTPAQWQQVIARVRAIPAYLAAARIQLTDGARAGRAPDWRVLQQFGLGRTAAAAQYFLQTLPGLAAARLTGAAREEQLRQLQQAGKDAAGAYLQLRDFVAAMYFVDTAATDERGLKPQYRGDRFATGEAEYDWALHNNLHLETTAAALFTQSWAVVEATRAQLIILARSIAAAHHWSVAGAARGRAGAAAAAAGTGIRAQAAVAGAGAGAKAAAGSQSGEAIVREVFAQLSRNAPTNDAAMVDAYRSTGARLVAYARATHLFAVPADYHLEVALTPPPLPQASRGAAYYPAPAFAPDGVGRFYVTPTGDDPALLCQLHSSSSMAALAAEEGFPGHDWQYRMMRQYRDVISPVRWLAPGAGAADSSSMWADSLATQGWARYAQGLLAEPRAGAPHGFYGAEEHLYELREQLYRDLQVRIDTGIHTGRLRFEDAVTLLSEVVDFQPGSCRDAAALQAPAKAASCEAARAAVRREARSPTRALTYRLGRDQILALRRRAQRLFGADFSLQRFHLELMKQGAIPSGYFAEELLRTLGRPPR